MVEKNITYLLGAGASYNASPILNEQGEKMIELAQIFKKLKDDGFFNKNESLRYLEEIFSYMGDFGKKAKEFGTIDTYARKLYLNDSSYELEKLKVAVSLFFTIWQLTDNKDLKKLENRSILEIDNRYISLFATILEKKDGEIVMKENINFVTWNYDLQLEYTFKLFTNSIDWDDLSNCLKFRVNGESELQICHLNGYHGFYNINEEKKHFLDRTESKKIEDIIKEIGYVSESDHKGNIDVSSYINYAWEESEIDSNSRKKNDRNIASNTRKEAKRIFKQTDILIIIGYSFPNFNKEIDESLFKELEGRETEIYYQDPNATDEFISQLFNMDTSKIHLIKKPYQFSLPYSF